MVYNFGLGHYLNSGVGNQACGPASPGKVVNITDINTQMDRLKPGDLLYLGAGSTITHVFIWTGYKMTPDSSRLNPMKLSEGYPWCKKTTMLNSMLRALNKNTFVVADSSSIGPNYRPFIGWYLAGFQFARRLINPNEDFKGNATNVIYSQISTTCVITI